ncbi:response regulator [Marinimicrobium agarilyticum]|uniref:response regulator n=1 Tax=Marinimicrobium agarilyticum TaxID=306546 RepID=UPI00041FD669|nr:response regulator [Marinimicrobium agarilyticum]
MTIKRALIVDDSKTAQHRLKRMLKKYDLDIVAVDSAESALSYLSSSVPDVVFMDHLMPGMDGFRALQIIKSHPATATIPVIMYTSKSGDVYTSQARALGALDVVSKDTINASDLRDVLKAIHIYPLEDDSSQSSKAAPPKPVPAPEAAPLATLSERPTEERRQHDRRQGTLSTELRLRDLEHSIDDSRRIITSRLVREVQGVRHEVRKVLTDMTEMKNRVEAEREPRYDEPPPAPEPARRLWPTALVLVLAGVVCVGLWQINQRIDQMAREQAEGVRRLAEQLPPTDTVAMTPAAQLAEPEQAESDNLSNQYLPDLSWALNQSSVQPFHKDIVSPELQGRLRELVARLDSRHFQGRVRLSVMGGDFCIVTNMSGEAQLPADSTQLGGCILMSEFHGAEPTELMAERLGPIMREAAMLSQGQIQVSIQPMVDSFQSYPPMTPTTNAGDWNQAAQANNRVLVSVEPEQPKTAQSE